MPPAHSPRGLGDWQRQAPADGGRRPGQTGAEPGTDDQIAPPDEAGLDRVDRAILEAVVMKFDGGPVGLSTLAISVSEEQQTVEDAYEPFLIQTGFLQRTPRGRVATALAYRHLGMDVPSAIEQGKLL